MWLSLFHLKDDRNSPWKSSSFLSFAKLPFINYLNMSIMLLCFGKQFAASFFSFTQEVVNIFLQQVQHLNYRQLFSSRLCLLCSSSYKTRELQLLYNRLISSNFFFRFLFIIFNFKCRKKHCYLG